MSVYKLYLKVDGKISKGEYPNLRECGQAISAKSGRLDRAGKVGKMFIEHESFTDGRSEVFTNKGFVAKGENVGKPEIDGVTAEDFGE